MSDDLQNQPPPDEAIDEELVLIFLTNYRALEQALVRAGFTRAGRTPEQRSPDWERFARHIEGQFHPESAPELLSAVGYMLADPDKHEIRNARLRNTFPGEPSAPESDVVWLSELVQEIGNKLDHWINFMEKPEFEDTDILAATFVIEAWASIDPKVASLLKYEQ